MTSTNRSTKNREMKIQQGISSIKLPKCPPKTHTNHCIQNRWIKNGEAFQLQPSIIWCIICLPFPNQILIKFLNSSLTNRMGIIPSIKIIESATSKSILIFFCAKSWVDKSIIVRVILMPTLRIVTPTLLCSQGQQGFLASFDSSIPMSGFSIQFQ